MYIVKQNKNKNWIIIKKGAKRATKVFNSKAEAIAYAEAHYKGNYDIAFTNVDNVIRSSKKKPGFAIALISLLVIAIVIVVVLFATGVIKLPSVTNKPAENSENTGSETGGSNSEGDNHTHTGDDGITENIIYDDFQIHFMMLGNDAAGDSIYIKAGDTDVLIDAGSKAASYTTTSAYINNYCTDKKFEYAIATHGDADHIYAYPNFLNNYEVDTMIDFTSETYNEFQTFKNSGAKTRSTFVGTTKTTTVYSNYLKARDSKVKKHYTAAECFNNENGAKAEYQLSEYVTMTILYNYYYFNNSDDENNFSVCTLFTYSKNNTTKNFILTGDLELEGEKAMASYYDGSTKEKTLPKVELYKAGHHGSKTSSNDCLLSKIEPKICVACCCAGTSEYTNNVQHQFPTQSFINHISKYTSRVYVPSMLASTSSGYEATAMNGNIVVSSSEAGVGLYASNNLTKLKDSAWFNEEIYAIKTSVYKDEENGDSFDVYQNCSKSKTTDFYTASTAGAVLVKRRYWPSDGVN